MTNETSSTLDTKAMAQEVKLENSQDWFLEHIIGDFVNKGLDIGVTLNVGGVVVSGMLINGKKYFEALAENMDIQEGEISKLLGGHWKGYAAVYEKPDDAPEDWVPNPIGYIHLANAKIHAPGQSPIPSNDGVLWRGKLSSVDGFFIGNISQG
ncbi:hypothetical protein SAMN04488005_0460 [Yoonia tamlensis]|uniref:Gas vesicle protein n=1 Tax=Yoonia tamlensis TaxID=390270 RepID=A0A1I6FTL7_9RHOB|nr:gas vesicle accessory protein GvpU [Yoonia tamlensis]SFR33244.1 hypothetical protein SAMN04488005_0460 [Yoonia tamlensis]